MKQQDLLKLIQKMGLQEVTADKESKIILIPTSERRQQAQERIQKQLESIK